MSIAHRIEHNIIYYTNIQHHTIVVIHDSIATIVSTLFIL